MADSGPPCRVLVHNDNTTPMDFVVRVLCEVFRFSDDEATRLMLVVHNKGMAEVARLVRDQALDRVDEIHALAAREGHALTASVSPVQPTRPRSAEHDEYFLDLTGLSREQFRLIRELVDQLRASRADAP